MLVVPLLLPLAGAIAVALAFEPQLCCTQELFQMRRQKAMSCGGDVAPAIAATTTAAAMKLLNQLQSPIDRLTLSNTNARSV